MVNRFFRFHKISCSHTPHYYMSLRCSLSSVSSLSLHFKSITTFPIRQSEGVKITKVFWSLDTNHCGICEGCYIYDLPRNLVISTWTVQTLFSKYATHEKKCKTKYCLTKNFLGDVYIRPIKSFVYVTSSKLFVCFFSKHFLKIGQKQI